MWEPNAKQSEPEIKTRKIRNRKKEQKESYSEFAYERYNKVEASAMIAVSEIPSSNNLRLQNLVESQLEITKTESCLNALSAKFALEKSYPYASRRGLLIYFLQGQFELSSSTLKPS